MHLFSNLADAQSQQLYFYIGFFHNLMFSLILLFVFRNSGQVVFHERHAATVYGLLLHRLVVPMYGW